MLPTAAKAGEFNQDWDSEEVGGLLLQELAIAGACGNYLDHCSAVPCL